MTRSVNSCSIVAIHCVFSVKDNTHFYRVTRKLLALALCNDLYTLVVTTLLANAVCAVVLAALRAFYNVGRMLELPNAGTSFVLSGMRNLSLRYCHD